MSDTKFTKKVLEMLTLLDTKSEIENPLSMTVRKLAAELLAERKAREKLEKQLKDKVARPDKNGVIPVELDLNKLPRKKPTVIIYDDE
jgi:flagellar basal body-associated protein FliL